MPNFIKKYSIYFEPKAITRTDIGFPILTEEIVGYDRSLENIDSYDDGIVNEKGYISSKMVNGNLDALAKVILMHELSRSEELYNHYLKNRGLYLSQLEYLTSLKNLILHVVQLSTIVYMFFIILQDLQMQ